ncbi:MAG: sugar ABC transporter substrate-binding protein [Caldilineaceae bacterium]|nr:sugar ABC transporter substrate-binding protein [Caldilineaceae bacterium]
MKNKTLLTVVLGALLLAALLTGCSAPAAPGDSAASTGGDETIELTFALGGSTGEIAGYQRIIDAFEAENPGVTIELLERPGQGFRDQIIAELAAGEAPDILKAGFVGEFAFYAGAGATVDLTPYLEEGYSDDFFPAAWTIATYEGRPYGLPMVSDTHALFYNTDYIEQAGIEVPQTMDECWSWEEFNEQSRIAMENSDADYGHAALWNAKRWMLFLYGNGGQVLTDDLSASAINSEATIETINWMKSWYDEGLAPGSTSMKASEQANQLFINGSIAFFISGSWHMPDLREQMTSMGWDVTYLPCTPNGQDADLGGNGLVITKDSEHPEIAAEFLKFATSTDNMREYAASAFFNPVRKSATEGLEYPEFNEQMLLFSEVAATVDPHHAAVQGMSIFPQFATIMTDELDLAFVGGQDAETTAQNMEEKINAVLAQ